MSGWVLEINTSIEYHSTYPLYGEYAIYIYVFYGQSCNYKTFGGLSSRPPPPLFVLSLRDQL